MAVKQQNIKQQNQEPQNELPQRKWPHKMCFYKTAIFPAVFFLSIFIASCTGSVPVNSVYDPDLRLEFTFCRVSNCDATVKEFLRIPGVSCAFYDLKKELLPSLGSIPLVTDSARIGKISTPWIRFASPNRVMHNKFCVADNAVLTGSFNPTGGRNQDVVIRMYSPHAAKNFKAEFDELWFSPQKIGLPTDSPVIQSENLTLQTYFCPDDPCEKIVAETLAQATSSIEFMVFSFTSDKIGDMLVEKSGQGVKIKGVYEPSQRNAYDEFDKLQAAGIPVQPFEKKGLLHHKTFVVDNKTIITGSANPTKNGYYQNDENLLIITSPEIAEQFLQEFEAVKALI